MKSKYQNGTNQNLQKLKKISKNLDDWRIYAIYVYAIKITYRW